MPLKRSLSPLAPVDDRASEQEMDGQMAAAMLDSDQTLVRLKAIRFLGTQADEDAKLALCRRLAAEPDFALRDAITVELARMGGETVVNSLLPLLSSDDAGLRNIVIDILKELPQDVAPRMESLLDDPDPDVRIFLINVLEALRHPAVEDWLIAVISMDTNANVIITALDLLNEVGTHAALPALRQTALRFADEPFVVFSVDSALRRIGGHS
jgi:HEAT repeat protein